MVLKEENELILEEESILPIVGIGSSAGGLEALEKLFSNMPTNSRMAFVVIPHLDPNYKSQLCELIQKYTRMEVSEVVNEVKIKPNHVYIIPPNKNLAIENGKLVTSVPKAPRGLRLPIDFFFRSLALNQKENAICIILSGTGTDGTLGLREVKGVGGMVMVQVPESAKYDGMPRSAINSALVDYIIPPEDMPNQLIEYINQIIYKKKDNRESVSPLIEDNLKHIYQTLQSYSGFDFSAYKKNTIIRRIEKRMTITQISNINKYLKHLEVNKREAENIFQEILIGVTNFFRDKEAFEVLKENILPDLIKHNAPDHILRIWVPACSTGEEAYSVAMLVEEAAENSKRDFKYQIFATDIIEQSIEKARRGLYPDNITVDIDSELIPKYFHAQNKMLQIKKTIRDKITFAVQNLVTDPPFSRMDLICCRNLLIYLVPEIQKKLFLLFHYSLNPGGYLFLGNSESISRVSSYFSTINHKWKIFQRIEPLIANAEKVRIFAPLVDYSRDSKITFSKISLEKMNYNEIMESYLLKEYAPCGVIINKKNDILYFHGRTGKFLEPSEGHANLNILEMTRADFRLELATAIRRASSRLENVILKNLNVKTNGKKIIFNLLVKPILKPASMEGLFIILFEENKQEDIQKEEEVLVDDEDIPKRRVHQLEDELNSMKHHLQTTIEELETSNEELKSTNEELQSSNEELQSTNEELHTSKEELQSINEELLTVNTELEQKITDLTKAQNDISNLIASTNIGIMFLDMNLLIQRFTPPITKIFNLIKSDIGRPIAHISTNLRYSSILRDLEQIKKDLVPMKLDVQDKNGNWYLIRINPYITTENVNEGLVISMLDITERKIAEEKIKQLATIVADSNDAITVQNLEGNIVAWNKGAELIYGYNENEVLEKNIDIIIPDDYSQEYKDLLAQVKENKNIKSFETVRRTKEGQLLNVLLTVTPLSDEENIISAISTTERDITKYKKAIQVHFYKDLFAHDMNNILQSISLLVDYYSIFKNDSDKMRKIDELFEKVKNQIKRGSRLIENVQKLTMLDEAEIELVPISIKSVLNKVVEQIIGAYQERNVKVNIDGLNEDVKVLGNDLLIEIFDNLLNNAVKYNNNDEEAVIDIEISKFPQKNFNFIKFEFIDYGIGVSDTIKDSIFERSYHTNKNNRGMGIGLSLVQKIVEIYEGKIWVEDRTKGDHNKGSKFILLLREA